MTPLTAHTPTAVPCKCVFPVRPDEHQALWEHGEHQAPLRVICTFHTPRYTVNPNCPNTQKLRDALHGSLAKAIHGDKSSSSATHKMRGRGQGPRRYLNNKIPTKRHQNTISTPPRGVSRSLSPWTSPRYLGTDPLPAVEADWLWKKDKEGRGPPP